MATNNSINKAPPWNLAAGGTNATSFATSNGIVKYDGTRLVTSSASTIDSSNRQQNTAQPCFLYTQTSDQSNVTGDGTDYTVTFTTSVFDQASNFSTSTFTAPVTGRYRLIFNLLFTGQTSVMTNNLFFVVTTAATYRIFQYSAANQGISTVAADIICNMTAADTAVVHARYIGGTKTVTIQGATNAGFRTPWFGGYLIC